MTKVLCALLAAGMLFFASSNVVASDVAEQAAQAVPITAPEPPKLSDLARINRVEIGVQTKQMRVFGKTELGNDLVVILSVGTALPGESSNGIPYGKIGKIKLAIFNPKWTPTAQMQKDQKKKGLSPLKATPPGSKHNPLGWVKFFFFYNGHKSLYGAHTTDNPKSVGTRCSHGCNRMSDNDAFWFAYVLLSQNGKDIDALFAQAAQDPFTPLPISLTECPEIVYMKK